MTRLHNFRCLIGIYFNYLIYNFRVITLKNRITSYSYSLAVLSIQLSILFKFMRVINRFLTKQINIIPMRIIELYFDVTYF